MASGNAGCLCGKVRLAIEGAALKVVQCHCTDCQKSTGGGPALLGLFSRDKVAVVAGEPAGHSVTGASGGKVTRRFCGACGSPLYSELEKYPNMLAIKAGVFDHDPKWAAEVAIWTASAPGWHHIPDDIAKVPGALG